MQFLNKTNNQLNVLRITLVNVKITFSPESYRKWAKNSFYQNLNLDNWNLKILLSLFPFFVGVSQLIFSIYKYQTFSCFFEKTIPANQILKETTSWETFNFIKLKNLKFNKIRTIHIYNDSFVILFDEQNEKFFIGFISNKENPTTSKINSLNYKLVLNDFFNFYQIKNLKKRFFFSEIYYNLDELPLKVEPFIKNGLIKNSFFDLELKNFEAIKFNFLQKNFNLNNKKTSFFFSNQLAKSQKNETIGLKNSTIDPVSALVEKRTNSSLKTIIQKELNFLIYKKNLQPVFNLKNKFQSSKNYFSKKYSSRNTLNILNDYLPLQKNDFLKIRKVSGYFYPDSTVNDVYSLFFNFLIQPSDFFREKPTIGIKTNLPASFINPFDQSAFPRFLIKNLKITYQKDNFFGINLNDALKSEWKNIILKDIRQKEKSIDDIDDLNPDNWFLFLSLNQKGKAFDLEKNEIKESSLLTDFNPFIFSQNNKLFPLKKEKLIYHYFPFSENLINTTSTNNSHFGEIYKRLPNFSTSLKQKSFTFSESWEPLSLQSWLILLQFSVGLFFLRLLKDLYKDYGKELVSYFVEFADSSGIDVEEIKEQYLYDESGFRLIKDVKKKFKDIAGIDNILPELSEIVWYLRNHGRSSKLKSSIPQGLLLTGPPGTGKTLLVQALAGEAQVAVIVESGSLLSDPQQKGRGVEKLKKIFDQARQLAPCILFIDEVDTIGEKRQNIIQTAMGGDELIESIYQNKIKDFENNFIPQPSNLDEDTSPEKDLEYKLFRENSENKLNIGINQFQKNIETKKTRLNLLTQFLVEMDGLKQRQGIIVIGATNRPNVLDPALIRPGRFDKTLRIELPGKKKRIEILKLYSKKLQIDKTISWEYLANRTHGFSAADLAAAMNESALQAILKDTRHTIETIERGIDLVTSYPNENTSHILKKENGSSSFFITRLAYYQAGKATLQTLFPNHNPVVILPLWPKQKNARHARFYEKSFSENKTRSNLEIELIILYSGKAAEFITLFGNKNLKSLKYWQSDLGIDDLLSATFLANLMVDKWSFYSNRILSRKSNTILNNRNSQEFQEIEKLEIISTLENQIEDEIEIEQIAKLFRTSNYQQRGFGPWWQIQVSKQIAEIDSFFSDWYRIYLPDPEESFLNLEWLPPDEFYHTNESLKKLSSKSDPSFNDLYKIERDYIYQGLILNAFNKAFSELEHLREFLDYFADYLLRYNFIREIQISYILKNIQNSTPIKEKTQPKEKILMKNWGKNSRRTTFRYLNLRNLKIL